jgi:hypothetical protein
MPHELRGVLGILTVECATAWSWQMLLVLVLVLVVLVVL